MRLIDADALSEHMYHEAFETDSGLQKWESGLWIRYRLFTDTLNTEITVDAEPVRHGHWIVDEDGNIKCSECGHHGVGDNYCERCGAKMDR